MGCCDAISNLGSKASRVLNGLQRWRIGTGVRRKQERDEIKKS